MHQTGKGGRVDGIRLDALILAHRLLTPIAPPYEPIAFLWLRLHLLRILALLHALPDFAFNSATISRHIGNYVLIREDSLNRYAAGYASVCTGIIREAIAPTNEMVTRIGNRLHLLRIIPMLHRLRGFPVNGSSSRIGVDNGILL